MAGLVPAIHVVLRKKTWMPGIKPGMTKSIVAMPYSAGFAVAASAAFLAASSARAFFSTMRTDQIEPS